MSPLSLCLFVFPLSFIPFFYFFIFLKNKQDFKKVLQSGGKPDRPGPGGPGRTGHHRLGGPSSAGATITSCYTTGQVLHASTIGTSGNIVGSQAVNPVNCYYLDTNALSGAGDSTTTTARTAEELKAPDMPAALGTAFAYDSNNYNNGYPVLAWQNGFTPEPVSHAVTLSFDSAAATVSASTAEAAPGENVTITITDLAAGKRVQSVEVLDSNSVACPVTTVAENASYTFTMGSSAVTVTVLFENISAGGEPYAYTIEPGIDPIWTVDVASSGPEGDKIAAGSTVTVTVNRMAGAIMASLEGITVRDAHGGTVAAETISTTSGGYNTTGGGVYTFTMPESTVTIDLNVAFAELSIYTQAGENGTATLVKTYSREEIIALAGSQTIYYTGYDRYPTAVIGKAAQAVRLTDLLDDAGLNFGVCDTLNAYRFVYGQTEMQFNGGVPLQENATVGDFLKYTCSLTIVTPKMTGPQYVLTPLEDEVVYTVGETDGIKTMTVKEGAGGLKYFGTRVTPVVEHEGKEAVVFTHLRDGLQLSINITRADFDLVDQAQAGFNVQAGDTIRVYIVDDLTNDPGFNPTLLQ